jgi:hypothetical protein
MNRLEAWESHSSREYCAIQRIVEFIDLPRIASTRYSARTARESNR